MQIELKVIEKLNKYYCLFVNDKIFNETNFYWNNNLFYSIIHGRSELIYLSLI
jgi:hypothetical protein